MKKIIKLFVVGFFLFAFSGCITRCPTMTDFLKQLKTFDRSLSTDTMRVRVFSFPLPNDVMGSQDELQPYGELVEKWINESEECSRVVAIGLAIDGIRPPETFRRLVFSVFYEPAY